MKTALPQKTSKPAACRQWLLILATFLLAALLPAASAFAAKASLTWVPPSTYVDGTPLSSPNGYKLYIGNASHSYDQVVNVGNQTSYTVANLADGATYYFAVTAYDQLGNESPYSAELSSSFQAAPATYSLTATASSGGSITAQTGYTALSQATNGSTTISTVTVLQGANQTFAITPATGYTIAAVTVDGVAVGAVASYSFSNVTTNHTINASFAVSSYTITASAGTGGSISPSGAQAVAYGSSKSFTVTPASGYAIAAVTVDGVAVGAVASYTFSNVTANHTINVSFAANSISGYTITASAGTGGSISPSGAQTVTSGSSKSFTFTPATGYYLAGVTVDGMAVAVVSSYTFSNVAANHTISATFAANTGKVAFAVNCGGSKFTDSTGVVYQADSKYSGGYTNSTTSAIGNTVDDALYKNWRYGTFAYNIPLTNGNYAVTLKFADWDTAVGQRLFNVALQGVTVMKNFDIYATAGTLNAYDVTIPVTVSNGTLTMNFTGVVDTAKINAIVVRKR